MTPVSPDAAANTLDRYGLEDAEVTLISNVDCAVFQIRARGIDGNVDRGLAVLKVYPERKQEVDAIEAEVAWLAALLRDTPLRVPRPLPARDGAIIQRVDCGPLAGPRCVLFSWIEGQRRDADLTPAAMRTVGRFVGQLHRQSSSWSHRAGLRLQRRTSSQQAPGWLLGMERRPATLLETDWQLLVAAAHKLNARLRTLGEHAAVFGLIHSDLSLSNFLFDADHVGVVDFSDCAWGHYADDIASVLVFLEHPWVGNHDHTSSYAAFRKAFFDGYEAEHPLPPGLDAALALYMSARIFLLAAYVHDAKDVVPWVPSCLERSMAHLEGFVSESSS